MTRHLLIFAACFLIGAVITAAIRTARHDAYAEPASAPAAPPSAMPAAAAPAGPHTGHVQAVPDSTPVNTVCAICGMPVNPKLPTAVYQGKTIGFGCKACPAKFAADPDHYGPAFLKNQVVE